MIIFALCESGESLASNNKFSGSTYKKRISTEATHFSGAGTLVLLDIL